MMKFRKREDFYQNRGGVKRFFIRGWQMVSYPFRRVWFWLLVLAVAFLVPTFTGVKPAEVHLWYWNKVKNAGTRVSSRLENSVIGRTIKESPFAPKGVDKLVESTDNRSRNLRRRAFEKAEGAPAGVDVMKQSGEPVVVPFFVSDVDAGLSVQNRKALINERSPAAVIRIAEPEDIQEADILQLDDYRQDVEGLVYLDKPEIVSGKPLIYNANAIDLNGDYIFLYGIYADPAAPEGERAKIFLEREVENRYVTCKIVAYTAEEVATAICYFNGININRFMVDNDLSLNVAL